MAMKIERELKWIELPDDIMANILKRLEVVEILESAAKVCTTWRRICSDPAMWREIDIDIRYPRVSDTKLWRRAVDLSQGQLTDLFIINYWDNNLLNYILNRSSGLKRLTLVGLVGFTGQRLVEAVKKLSQLEGLHLSTMPGVTAQDIINIGISCPNLKSFTYNPYPLWMPGRNSPCSSNNEYALAIAETMPNLRHLRLVSNPIDNTGLEAILNACPNLESLDLLNCSHLDLRGALGKRCSQQIKQLTFPSRHNKYGSFSDINQDDMMMMVYPLE